MKFDEFLTILMWIIFVFIVVFGIIAIVGRVF